MGRTSPVGRDEQPHDCGPSLAQLRELADSYGVDTEYWDWHGTRVSVSADTLRAVLGAFGVDTASRAACGAALAARRDGADLDVLPPCLVLRAGRARSLPGHGTLDLESGHTVAVDAELPDDLPLGYHRLVLADGRTSPVIVTPDRVPLPDRLARRPGWGLAVQLYSVRSRASWGVGDLGDLRTLAVWAAGHGADFVLVNPVHAGEIVTPVDPSPYLPTSRRFANPLYLHIEDLPEYAAAPAEVRAAVDRLADRARTASGRGTDARIERDPVWTAKLAALDLLLGHEDTGDRTTEYVRYRDREGAALQRFATWAALCERYGNDWRGWPTRFWDPDGPAVAAFAQAHRRRVEFFARVQWLLDEQLRSVQRDARAGGMALGVVHDVAVGVSPGGADAWAHQDAMATACTVGAPPDAYSQLGQDWQQPPWRPDRLAELGYAPIREMFATALRSCGGLRVDHVLGLFRLWWIPPGRPAVEGTYVRYDSDALIGILTLEAFRAGAVVVGEDLGNVEPTVHDRLRERGLLGTSILWFERDPGDRDRPRPAADWRRLCLASVTTHDLPPTAGYLADEHVWLRDRLGLLTRPRADELEVSAAERQAWVARLREDGLLPAGSGDETPTPDELLLALHRFVAATPAVLRCVALTDAVGDRRAQNQPGTRDEYPNWRIPLAGPDGTPVLLDDLVHDARAAGVLRAIAVSPAAC